MPTGIRNFLISFLLSALIFTGVAYFAVQAVGRAFNDIENSSEDIPRDETSETSDRPSEPASEAVTGTVLNFVLIGTDYQPEIFDDYTVPDDSLDKEREKCADTILFVSFSTRTNLLIVCPIPSQTLVELDHENVALGSTFHYKGPAFICDKVASLVGQPIPYYASVSMGGLAAIVDYLGGIQYDVPCDMFFEKELGDIHIDLKKGPQQLNGDEVIQMLRYNEYGDTDTRTALAGEFFYKFLSTEANYTNKKNYTSLFSVLLPYLETNVTLGDVTTYLSVIFGHTIMTYTPISYPGAYSDRFFMPNLNGATELLAPYFS